MKTLQHIFILPLIAILASVALGSCIEDGISSSPADQPEFSTDTLQMGTIFTLSASPTHRFIVHNRHDKGINISRISFADDPHGIFRLNVDGISAREFSNVEIRENDSIFIFVEATLPENGVNTPVDILAHIEFVTNGINSSLPVKVTGRDVVRLKGDTRFSGTSSLSSAKPYFITDSMVVEAGATLTIPAGTELYFHDKARMVVHGSLVVDGSAEAPVNMTGDRTGFVAASIPYELMSGQWHGIEFTATSSANKISHASIRNSSTGLILINATSTPSEPALQIINSQVRNTTEYTLLAIHSNVDAHGCEFTDASLGLVALHGGNHTFSQCTFANYYLFSAIGGPALQFSHINSKDAEEVTDGEDPRPYLSATIANSIIYGNGVELSHANLTDTDIYIHNCLLKSNGTDDDHFIQCIWGEDPLYYTVRNEYIFDYRVKPKSPAIAVGNSEFLSPLTSTDRFGTPRNATAPTLGAYEFTVPEPEEE